ncbi:LRR receptor-like serine/threonine-protein kinase EFR [Forsythia ovata]|uniref:non-specific serine/threonine protein kinase n=1 Tax=Forsythia ovata TaxID=205694 RepID=A0ABD1WV56_9LAMI
MEAYITSFRPPFSTSMFVVILVLLNLLFLQHIDAASVLENETDKLALLALKSQITNDPEGILASWNSSSHFCRLMGVIFCRKHQRVTSLDLRGKKLAGIIAPSIGNLSFLYDFDLSDNFLLGGIPSEFGSLRRVQNLNMSFNFLEGEVPANLSRCLNLVSLSLRQNVLIGIIPPEIGSLSKLVRLNLRRNNITGTIPGSIGNLTSLQRFDVSYNKLKGGIPNTISQFVNLNTFVVSVNNLSGEFPSQLYNLTSLEIIILTYNKFNGNIRTSFGLDLPNLKIFYIGYNFFTGQIPDSLFNASALEGIDVIQNNFTGKVPLSFGTFGNNFVDGIPDSIGMLSELVTAYFHDNQLTGEISSSFGNMSQLESLFMFNHHFTGTIPASLATFKQLLFLYVDKNKLRGNIQPLMEITSLLSFDLASNTFTGFLPSFENLSRLLDFRVSHNKFSGEIPRSIGKCLALENIWMQNNSFQGSIPYLKDLTALKQFDLSSYNLSGEIPRYLANISSLFALNLSFNNLEGELPLEGVFANLGAVDIIGNSKVCGGILDLNLPQCRVQEPQKAQNFSQLGEVATFRRNNVCLNILQRLNIVIDVASALFYLHHQCQTPVVHSDLNPQNVLLDDDLTPYVGDFGLARLLPMEAISQEFSSLGIKGTIGYAAPEYGMGSQESIQGDVYSFGILLLEIFTGRRPTDGLFQENMNLHLFVKMGLPEQLVEILDKSSLREENQRVEEAGPSTLRSEQTACLISILNLLKLD